MLVVAFVFLAAGCAPKAATTDTAAGAKALTQLDDDWSKAAGAKNVDLVASFYAQDAIAYPPAAPAAVGFVAAKAVWASYFADSTFSISWKTDHVAMSQAGDFGYTAGSYEDSYKGPDGAMVEEKGKYVCVWAKQPDGSWKAVHDIWNSDAK
jgi:ketosteroid isomerase-like protein